MNRAEEYIKTVVDHLPRGPMRQQISMELRGSIRDRIDNGHSLDDVLIRLGDPRALAESYLEAIPLASATFRERALAKIIDILVIALSVLPVIVIAGQAFSPEVALMMAVGALVIASFGFGLYTIGSEYWMGQTVGKHLMGLRVVRESGAPIGLGQSIVRQVPMFLQFYWVDVLFAVFTERSQRAFEILSKTRVVKASSLVVEPFSRGQAD